MALGSHFLLDMKVGAYTESEKSLSSGFDEHLQGHCVLMVDRGLIRIPDDQLYIVTSLTP